MKQNCKKENKTKEYFAKEDLARSVSWGQEFKSPTPTLLNKPFLV
jgi:hypothetical protein